MSSGPRIALTGATGFLGSHIADGLLARGHAVRAAVRPSSNLRWLEGKGIEIVTVDLNDADACCAFAADCAGLIHCAGVVTAPDEAAYQRANVNTTETLLAAARDAWAGHPKPGAFVLISSLAAHGPAPLDAPAREDDTPGPITGYGRSKLAAEEAVRQGGWPFRCAILRPPSLYGPRDREFQPLLKSALMGFTARLGRRMTGLSLVDGRDAAAAAIALLECPAAEGPFFVDDGHRGYDWDELRDILGRVAGKNIRTLSVPLGFLRFLARVTGPFTHSPVLNADRLRDLDTPGWVCDGRRLEQTTGWCASRDATTGLKETLAFMKEHDWL